jgi:hypothetical protein
MNWIRLKQNLSSRTKTLMVWSKWKFVKKKYEIYSFFINQNILLKEVENAFSSKAIRDISVFNSPGVQNYHYLVIILNLDSMPYSVQIFSL